MKLAGIVSVVVLTAVLNGAKACSPFPLCNWLESKRMASSDLRQMRCERESSSQNPELLPLLFVEAGERWICAELEPTDPQFDSKFQYPPKPESFHSLKGTHSYVHMMPSGNEQIVNCFQSPNAMDELVFSASKGFFPVVNVKEDIRYLCIHANKLQQSLGDRLSRALASNCGENAEVQ